MTKLKLHRIPMVLALSVIVMVMGLMACNSITDLSQSVAPVDSPDKVDPVPIGVVHLSQELLHDRWERSSHTDWDILTCFIEPVGGGRLQGTPASWPTGYVFGAFFPAGFIASTDSLEITLKVPRYSEGVDYPAVYIIEPHGLVFDLPVTLEFCFPPWLEENEYYEKYYFWDETSSPVAGGSNLHLEEINPIPRYGISDFEKVTPDGEDLRLKIQFETLHFSRWGMENGKGGDEALIIDLVGDTQINNR